VIHTQWTIASSDMQGEALAQLWDFLHLIIYQAMKNIQQN
jgi:hypothetical protein